MGVQARAERGGALESGIVIRGKTFFFLIQELMHIQGLIPTTETCQLQKYCALCGECGNMQGMREYDMCMIVD